MFRILNHHTFCPTFQIFLKNLPNQIFQFFTLKMQFEYWKINEIFEFSRQILIRAQLAKCSFENETLKKVS